jgi:glutathione S-transferase
MLADDVRLDVVLRGQRKGRQDVGVYFTNYAGFQGWRVAPGWLDDDLRESANALLRPIFFLGRDETNPDVQNAAQEAHQELKRLEVLLERSPFLVGARVTAADCFCFPDARLILRATERFPEMMRRLEFHPFAEVYPRTLQWVERIEALPGYEKTFPAHWRST